MVLASLCLVAVSCAREDEPDSPRLVVLYATCTVNRNYLGPYDPDVDFTPHLDTFTFTLPGVHPFFGEKISVRIRGIDTPEIRGKCEAENQKAKAARDFLRNVLRNAGRIDLVDAERGKYFRIVATVQADGRNVAALLIARGLGRPYQGGRRAGWCGV